MSGALSGKTVMVLGGSSPYGASAARALGREGANVALGGRDRQRLEELEEEVRANGGEVLVLGVHLAKRHHPAHLVEAAVETFGGLDALLFMASATAPPLGSLDIDAWERSLDVNVRGSAHVISSATSPWCRSAAKSCACATLVSKDSCWMKVIPRVSPT